MKAWAVMKAMNWSSLTIGGFPMTGPVEGPDWFIPVFKTREDAVKWNNRETRNIAEMETVDNEQVKGSCPASGRRRRAPRRKGRG